MPDSVKQKSLKKLLRTAAVRESNCKLSLRVNSFDECSFSKDDCFTVTIIGDTSKCQTCVAPQLCNCLRDQFQSTTNSKRRVSTFLFWKNRLGLNFPVSDEMLRRAWKGLASCDNGIKQGNGQRKVAKGAVCVNPYHYTPNKWILVLESMLVTLDALGITQDPIVNKIAASLGWDGTALANLGVSDGVYEQAFDIISHRVRKMVDVEGYIKQLEHSMEESSADGGYETSSSSSSSENSSPPHIAEYFSPDSPPAQFVTSGRSMWGGDPSDTMPTHPPHDESSHTTMSSESRTASGDVSSVPSSQSWSDELAGLDEVLFGSGQDGHGPDGIKQEVPATLQYPYVAQHMLPRLQGRMWSAQESDDIAAYADTLLKSVEGVPHDDTDFMDLAEDGAGGEEGLPWASYMSTQVWYGDGNGEAQFASGVDVPDPSVYGLEQFDQVVPDMVSQYRCTPFSRQSEDGSVRMFGDAEAVGMQDYERLQSPKIKPSSMRTVRRTFCVQCKHWHFGSDAPTTCPTAGCGATGSALRTSSLKATEARHVPMVTPLEPLQHGDVVAMVRHKHRVDVVKADATSARNAECLGVFGLVEDITTTTASKSSSETRVDATRSTTSLASGTHSVALPRSRGRINLVGCVDVAVWGPVRNLDMLYVDPKHPGMATAIPPRQGTAHHVVGQVLDPRCGPAAGVAVPSATAPTLGKGARTTVRCIISPHQLKSDVIRVMTARTVAALRRRQEMSTSVSTGADDALAAPTPADASALDANARARVAAVTSRLERASRGVRTNIVFDRITSLASVAAVCDQSVVTLVSHATGKALRVTASGTVDGLGTCGDAASQFVLHHDSDQGTTLLQSVLGDDVWIALDSEGALRAVDDAADAQCALTLSTPDDGQTFTLSAKQAIDATQKPKAACVSGHDQPFRFLLYQRTSVASVAESSS
eukprot:m.23848 g.23848  ORF g.23848 m.23848 type:complete len:933 (-) comp4109_c0_seq1:197-2995(-)